LLSTPRTGSAAPVGRLEPEIGRRGHIGQRDQLTADHREHAIDRLGANGVPASDASSTVTASRDLIRCPIRNPICNLQFAICI
jgi:hypothetical protein